MELLLSLGNMESLSHGRDRPDTYAESHLAETAESAGAASNKAAANKISKYSKLTTTHHFAPISVETGGPRNPESSELIDELGKRICQITLEPLEIISFLKTVHMTAEGNELAFRKTFLAE